MTFDAVILGSGLGGLQCAYILAKNGKKVCVVEKNGVPGGCLQSFRRGGKEFDTGFHYVGALGRGQILEKLFRYFGLMELPWHQLDTDGFDEIVLKGKSYILPNGYEGFADGISRLVSWLNSGISAEHDNGHERSDRDIQRKYRRRSGTDIRRNQRNS